MKYLFTFLLCILSANLYPVFNLDVQNKSSTSQSSQTSSTTSQSTQSSSTTSSDQLDLSSAMNPNEQQSTGLNRLSNKQKAALSSWIESYSSTQAQKQQTQQAQVKPNAISAIVGDGHFVKLADGSVWNISPNSWINTFYWKQGDIVNVGKSLDTLFPYTLTNESSNLPVTAQKGSQEATSIMSESLTISAINDGGEFITLSNGSVWQVSSSLRYQSAGWSVGQSIFIAKAQGTGGAFNLLNGQTTRTVTAQSYKSAPTNKNSAANNSSSSNNSSQNIASNSNVSQNSSQTN